MSTELNQQARDIKTKIEQLVEIDKLDEALDIIKAYKQVIINDPEIYSIEGVAYVKLLDFESAEAVLKRGLIADITYFDILYNLAIVYDHLGRFEESKLYYTRSLQFVKDNTLAETIKGMLLNKARQIQKNNEITPEPSNDFIDILLNELFSSLMNNYHFNIDIIAYEIRGLPIVDQNYVNTAFNKEKILINFDGIANLFNHLRDEYSRNLLIKLIAYRILGNQKVMLPTNQKEYWGNREKAHTLINSKDTIKTTFLNLELDYFDLSEIGYDLRLYFNSIGVSNTFIEKQYEYNKLEQNIKVKEGDTVIDAGGCWGDTALYFAHEVGNKGAVYSYEFIPSNLEIMDRNINLNPSVKEIIKVVKKPVWSSSGETVYYQDLGPGSRVTNNLTPQTTGKSETLSIDDLVELYKIEKVDFIKMDIEGAELSALIGANQTIKKFRPTLAISLYHKISDFSDIVKYISELDSRYEYYLNHYTIFDEETILFAKPIATVK
ncbi:FkbM family methyltransferase [Paenibacillus sp. MZ04-78.2]|uniref:protein arginine N-methyltransferase n=1 Tax=Paenibacillus sp. MZ04-78.2 TaxID=2962034 RepID=UPI0020B8F9CA|nr:FkbM family methyltransferase [Paenibacillus sp. MZ04-78.2]MCP3775995.1 FkbM family methyltransferase [Paenibacillus sp. MZ04-78.2]